MKKLVSLTVALLFAMSIIPVFAEKSGSDDGRTVFQKMSDGLKTWSKSAAKKLPKVSNVKVNTFRKMNAGIDRWGESAKEAIHKAKPYSLRGNKEEVERRRKGKVRF